MLNYQGTRENNFCSHRFMQVYHFSLSLQTSSSLMLIHQSNNINYVTCVLSDYTPNLEHPCLESMLRFSPPLQLFRLSHVFPHHTFNHVYLYLYPPYFAFLRLHTLFILGRKQRYISYIKINF